MTIRRRRINEECIEPLLEALVKAPDKVLRLSFKKSEEQTKWYANIHGINKQ